MGKEKCNLLWYESAYFIFPRHQFDCMIMGIDINSWHVFLLLVRFYTLCVSGYQRGITRYNVAEMRN